MAEIRIRHAIQHDNINRMLRSSQGGVALSMLRRGKRVETRAKRLANVDTGRMRSTITTALVTRNRLPAAKVAVGTKYAKYVIRGTGIYGPHHQLIYPKTAKVLRWQGRVGARRDLRTGRFTGQRGTGGYVYAKYVRGIRPNNFLKDALPAARISR